MKFDNTYANLSEQFYARIKPTPVSSPKLVQFNHPLATELGLNPDAHSPEDWAQILSGNKLPDWATPIAQAYAGHQFGHFVPQLGDGRAILLGELIDKSGNRKDIQLKGSGLTPFSRGGDGRAALGPVIREYIVSEFMHAAGIPTTRALAIITTGDPVYRETPLPGAILVRVAASHIRIGTFEYFAARQDIDAIKTLADYAIERHYPDAKAAQNPYQKFFEAVCVSQAKLIAKWMGIGFIHGVMNTDNMTISGETIDYGPCAFMDEYDPAKVYSYIDHHSRYAYQNQAPIAAWNLSSLGECLRPFLTDVKAPIEQFQETYNQFWLTEMGQKIGIQNAQEKNRKEIMNLLSKMHQENKDFPNTFREISPSNPAYIPRNHQIEDAIGSAVGEGNFSKMHTLIKLLSSPYDDQPKYTEYTNPPTKDEVVKNTFCGT